MPKHRPLFIFACLALTMTVGCSYHREDKTEDGRTIVTLWTSWSGIERKGIDDVIDDYNASQDKLFVRSLNVTDPQTKIMLATAGGNPPDLAMLGNQHIPTYAENNALTPLDGLLQSDGIRSDLFVKTFWDTARYRGRTWAIPLTCSVTTLHYNKKIFREIGLDPEQPPKTIEELERINDLITQYRADGSIKRIGHLPLEPGWWRPEWSNWFGEGSFDGDKRMRFDQEGWGLASKWLASYNKRFGKDKLIKLRSGFGRFSSPQNPFFSGKVSMVLQGIWMHNFIEKFADPDFEYGIAPFPASKDSNIPYFSIADADLMIIPTGAKHLDGAFEFLKYLSSRAPLEKLALAHGKMTSLVDVSDEFKSKHPHPYLQIHIDIAQSGYAKARPQLAQYQNYFTEANEMVNSITYGLLSPEEALEEIQSKQQRTLDKKTKRWERVSETYQENWQTLIDETSGGTAP